MSDHRYPPGYIPLTIHELGGGQSSKGGQSRSRQDRSGGFADGNSDYYRGGGDDRRGGQGGKGGGMLRFAREIVRGDRVAMLRGRTMTRTSGTSGRATRRQAQIRSTTKNREPRAARALSF